MWKKRLIERKQFYKKRANISALRYRELKGCWPNGFNRVPGIRGLLYNKL